MAQWLRVLSAHPDVMSPVPSTTWWLTTIYHGIWCPFCHGGVHGNEVLIYINKIFKKNKKSSSIIHKKVTAWATHKASISWACHRPAIPITGTLKQGKQRSNPTWATEQVQLLLCETPNTKAGWEGLCWEYSSVVQCCLAHIRALGSIPTPKTNKQNTQQ